MSTLRSLHRSCTLTAVALLVSCGGDSTSPGGNNNPGGNTNGTARVSAKVDGVAWSDASNAATSIALSAQPGIYVMNATGSVGGVLQTIGLTMYNIRGPGTYPIGVGTTVVGASGILSVSTGAGWSTPLTGAAGTLVLTEVSATRLVGTFNMTLTPISGGATGTRTVTEGQFNVPLSLTATGTVPDNAGNKVSATLGSTPFNASAVAGSYTASSGQLVIIAGNTTQTVSLTLSGITAPGTYPLTSATSTRQLGVSTLSPTTQSWSSSGTGGSGTVVVTSLTASRIIGTFSGTLAPSLGTTTTMSVTNGVFDVGR